MIFISGIHGVGKTYFCNRIKEQLNIDTYSASSLISERKKRPFSPDKLVSDIDVNQQYLLAAVDELRQSGQNFLLDGHFCLLNIQGEVTRIGQETYTTLSPDAIILLTDEPEVIANRRKSRDGIMPDIEAIRKFQDEEISYAKEIASLLSVDMFVANSSQDITSTIDFINAH